MNKLEQGVYDADTKSDLNIITGQEVATNEYIDGSRVYFKRINIGAIATNKTVNTDLSNVSIVRISGIAKTQSNFYYPIPYASDSVTNTISILINASLNIYAFHGGAYTGNLAITDSYADIYYIKNT